MIATEETTTTRRYRGVSCGHCRQPIPLPGIVEKLVAADAKSPAVERNFQSFHLRCRVCQREKTYQIRDITEFEGVARMVRAAHV